MLKRRLSVYSRTGHVVEYHSPGTSLLTLPKGVDANSIIIMDADGNLMPFTYHEPTSLDDALKAEVEVSKNGEITTGNMLSRNHHEVAVLTGDTVKIISKYDHIQVRGQADFTHPRVGVVPHDKHLNISYLLGDVSWTCAGTALINEDTGIIFLRLAAHVMNDNDMPIQAHVFVVGGDVAEVHTPTRRFAQGDVTMASNSPAVASSQVEDYVKYDLDTQTLGKRTVVDIALYKTKAVKLYTAFTNSPVVNYGYRFKAPDYIPTSSVTVYHTSASDLIHDFIGADTIAESQKDTEVDLTIGSSTRVQCTTEIQVSDNIVSQEQAKEYDVEYDASKISWHVITEDLKVVIKNYNETGAVMLLKHYVGNNKLHKVSCKYESRKHGNLEWYIRMPAATKDVPTHKEFTCQVTTLVHY